MNGGTSPLIDHISGGTSPLINHMNGCTTPLGSLKEETTSNENSPKSTKSLLDDNPFDFSSQVCQLNEVKNSVFPNLGQKLSPTICGANGNREDSFKPSPFEKVFEIKLSPSDPSEQVFEIKVSPTDPFEKAFNDKLSPTDSTGSFLSSNSIDINRIGNIDCNIGSFLSRNSIADNRNGNIDGKKDSTTNDNFDCSKSEIIYSRNAAIIVENMKPIRPKSEIYSFSYSTNPFENLSTFSSAQTSVSSFKTLPSLPPSSVGSSVNMFRDNFLEEDDYDGCSDCLDMAGGCNDAGFEMENNFNHKCASLKKNIPNSIVTNGERCIENASVSEVKYFPKSKLKLEKPKTLKIPNPITPIVPVDEKTSKNTTKPNKSSNMSCIPSSKKATTSTSDKKLISPSQIKPKKPTLLSRLKPSSKLKQISSKDKKSTNSVPKEKSNNIPKKESQNVFNGFKNSKITSEKKEVVTTPKS